MRRRVAFALVALSLVLLGAASPSPTSSSTGPLVQIHQDFSADPHWEAYHNRVVAENPPTKKQDFGWSGNAAYRTSTILVVMLFPSDSTLTQ